MQKTYRLRDHRDFKRLYRNGQFRRGESLDIKTAPNQLEHCRVGVVVSAKVSKSAVKRTRMRRRLYGLMRELWGELAPGYDLVLIARRDFSRIPAAQVRTELKKLLKSQNLLS